MHHNFTNFIKKKKKLLANKMFKYSIGNSVILLWYHLYDSDIFSYKFSSVLSFTNFHAVNYFENCSIDKIIKIEI